MVRNKNTNVSENTSNNYETRDNQVQIITDEYVREAIDKAVNSEHGRNNQNDWRIIDRKQKTRRQIVQCTSNDIQLKGIMKQAIETNEDIVNYLKTKNIEAITCKQLISKYPKEYTSFRVSVSIDKLLNIMDPSLWPTGARINRFYSV